MQFTFLSRFAWARRREGLLGSGSQERRSSRLKRWNRQAFSEEGITVQNVVQIIANVDGWCTPTKATKLFELASAPECLLAVEIGVFGGKSLLPVATAFAQKKAGRIYGIEPWDNLVAVETVTNEANDEWWRTVDLIAIKRNFLKHVADLQLEEYIRLLEVPSDAAISIFQSNRYSGKINLVHIDGAHSVEQSVFDSSYWLKLLSPGGYLVLDDINWPSVAIAYEFLKIAATMTYSVGNDVDGHFAIFQKR
jgi:predicted O-methyltransferase YrrM